MCNLPEGCTPLRIRGRSEMLIAETPEPGGAGFALGLFFLLRTRLHYGRFGPRATGDGMEAPPPTSDMHAPAGFVTVPDPRRTEFILDALKTALAEPGEHRLFARGKIPGLFPARAGLTAE